MATSDPAFDERRHGPAVVTAWAPWCGSCRAMDPQVRAIATHSRVALIDLQVDADPELATSFSVRSVPTLIGLRDGDEVGRLVGIQPTDAIEALFRATESGDDEIVRRTPGTLIRARLAAGGALLVAGIALGSTVLVAVGAVLTLWALAGSVPRGR